MSGGAKKARPRATLTTGVSPGKGAKKTPRSRHRITVFNWSFDPPRFFASCACGWASSREQEIFEDRAAARRRGDRHLREMSAARKAKQGAKAKRAATLAAKPVTDPRLTRSRRK